MTSEALSTCLNDLLKAMDLAIQHEVSQDGELFLVNLTGADTHYLDNGKINRVGALATLVKLMLKQQYGEDPKIVFDINNERKQRLENVAKMAKKMAEMVRVKGEEEELPPMTPAERRAVHMELRDMP